MNSPQPVKSDVWADKVQSLFDDPSYEKVIMPSEVNISGQFLSYYKYLLRTMVVQKTDRTCYKAWYTKRRRLSFQTTIVS